ncbi:5-formyltetrahydrofolate cyclo-ligase [Williamsia sp.]|uniref:5-formyltetrahydrofolate cyclo-ligase n=1 Tax=Williamsia sp. TaxID=1872085 RepID=UPI0034572BAD
MSDTPEDSVAGAKAALRRRLIADRAAMDETERAAAATDLAGWMSVDVPFRLEADVTVCCYASVGTEPGTGQMLDALVDRGVNVLLPITPDGPPTALEWARYTGRHGLRTGRFRLSEPTGRRLSNTALDIAEVALIPALAVDRRGVRLGRGAGYYDRSLAATGAELVAVVFDGEVLDEIPADEYDIAVGWSLTPGDGFTRLG